MNCTHFELQRQNVHKNLKMFFSTVIRIVIMVIRRVRIFLSIVLRMVSMGTIMVVKRTSFVISLVRMFVNLGSTKVNVQAGYNCSGTGDDHQDG